MTRPQHRYSPRIGLLLAIVMFVLALGVIIALFGGVS